MLLAEKALQQSKVLQKFEFDGQAYTIRRNLMVSSSLAIAAAFVSPPPSGVYEVNLAIVKGVINNPILLYLFLGVVCLYYMLWFYIHCKKLVILNYDAIVSSFSLALAHLNADQKYREIASRQKQPQGRRRHDIPRLNFQPQRGGMNSAIVQGSLKDRSLRHFPDLEASLRGHVNFSVGRIEDSITISYHQAITTEDQLFLNVHLDHYWRSRKEEWFITVLPLIFSCIGLFAIGWRIYALQSIQPVVDSVINITPIAIG